MMALLLAFTVPPCVAVHACVPGNMQPVAAQPAMQLNVHVMHAGLLLVNVCERLGRH